MTYLSTPCGNHTITPASYPDVSLSRAKEGGKETLGETALGLPSVPFPWSLAAHHQSLASTLRKTKRQRRMLQSHTFAALIRLSTTTHNLLTFNISEISSNNSEKLSLLANKHLWTFLLHSSYSSSGCRVTRSAGTTLALFSHQKKTESSKSWPGSKFTCNFALT